MDVRRLAAGAVVLCLGLGFATSSFAWSEDGHRIVGALAAQHLTPKAQRAVRDLIAGADLERDCPIRSLEDAAQFPDCVRQKPAYQFMRDFHYDNPTNCGQPQTYQTYCPGGVCATSAIHRAYDTLRARQGSAKDQLLALAQIAHFVGDLHQPLHVSDKGDRGGNYIHVSVLGHTDAQDPSLHHAWDKTLVRLAVGPKATAVPALDQEIPAGPAPRQDVNDVLSWAQHSNSLAIADAYGWAHYRPHCPAPQGTTELDQAYVDKASPVIHAQLLDAAKRLAGLLNAAFS